MSKRSFQSANWTPTATADTTGFTANTYMAIQGGGSTQRILISEVMIEGLAASVSSPTIMQLARDSTVGVTPTALSAPQSDGFLDPTASALAAAPVTFTTAGTQPQRSASTSAARLNFSLNAYGGVILWKASDREEFGLLGNTASLGEASLSAFTGGTVGAVAAHLVYEAA